MDERINPEFDKVEMEVKADASVRSRDDMFTLASNLTKEVKEIGLMRLGYILDFMARAISYESNMKPDYDKYQGMYPVLKTEQLNTTYVVRTFLGEGFDPVDFDKLIFKEG